ncbi:hypothetical protein FOA52_000021 [Chlamydomonas sp. UWO 241]|nr:hypothetical protein FOA52_000021 [Chlamydomonas sp. UWO 241]
MSLAPLSVLATARRGNGTLASAAPQKLPLTQPLSMGRQQRRPEQLAQQAQQVQQLHQVKAQQQQAIIQITNDKLLNIAERKEMVDKFNVTMRTLWGTNQPHEVQAQQQQAIIQIMNDKLLSVAERKEMVDKFKATMRTL